MPQRGHNMQYFKIGKGRFIEYDDVTNLARIIIKEDLLQEKVELQNRIESIDPNLPKTNAEWIAYAKANYKYVDHSMEQSELDRVNSVLLAIKNL